MTIVDFIATLTASAAATVNLTRPEMQELQVLLDEPHENLPYLDRVRGVLNGSPLMRDRECFEELCDFLLRRFRLKELVLRLRSEVERQGGLLSPDDARIAYAMTQKASATVH
jgi:hypothetical protein